ncbi:MAG: alpha/beta hydrolase [Pseudomonadota bacterium]
MISLSLVSLAGCVTYLPAPVDEPEKVSSFELESVIKDLVFSESDWPQALTADLYLSKRPDARPVVLMVHGGGWAARDKDDMDAISHDLVTNGYAVLNVNHRFAPKWKHPAQLADMQQALKWISTNAGKYRFDLSRINTWGYSSGAHLAALIASYNYSDQSMLNEAENLPQVRAVVAGGIPSDLRKYEDGPIVRRFLGDSQANIPDVYADASPAFHIDETDPPVFIYHGKLDLLVRPDQAVDYYEALQQQGIDTELYLHAFREHMTMFLFGGDAEQKAIQFLNRKNQD